MHLTSQNDKSSALGLQKFVFSILIALSVLVAYSNNLQAPFVFDDHHNIVANLRIRMSRLTLGSIVTASTKNPTPRPIAYVSFALNHFSGGLKPKGFHITNNAIHAVNGVLVFFLLSFILKRLLNENIRRNSLWIAFAGALIFSLHPVQTQSVTYIVQRMASLCAMFYLASLLGFLYGRVATTPRLRYSFWFGALVLWILALGTKQLAVTLPVAAVLLEWIVFRDGDKKWLFKQGWLFGVILFAMAGVAFAFKGLEFFKLFTRGFARRDFTLAERLYTEGRIVMHYISLVLIPLPSRLTLIYDFPLSRSLLNPISTLISWSMVIAAIAFAITNAKKHKILSLSILWFFLHLAVESTIIPLELAYEHRLYLPLTGAALLLATATFTAFRNIYFSMTIVCTLSIALGFGTHVRNHTWNDGVRLWADNIKKQPTEPRAYFNLALHYSRSNDDKLARETLDKTIQLAPNFHPAFVRRGIMNESDGRFELALKDFDEVLAAPVAGRFDLSNAYFGRARIRNRRKNYLGAKKDLDQSIEIVPTNANAFLARAKSNVNLDLPDLAVQDFQKAIELRPDIPQPHNNFAWFMATHPDEKYFDPEQAVKHARLACELTAEKHFSPFSTLAAVYARKGDFQKAVQNQEKAIALAPANLHKSYRNRIKLYKSSKPFLVTTEQ